MIRAAVLTALMDGYDTLKPVLAQDGADVDWICLTDSKVLAGEAVRQPATRPGGFYVEETLIHPTGWEIVFYDRPVDAHPNRAAKLPKVGPTMFTNAPASVWIDASFRVVSPRLVVDTITLACESASGIAQFKHPWRDCLAHEAKASIELEKYADQRGTITQQVAAYLDAGMPRHWGLWATGVIARRHDERTRAWGLEWGQEIVRHSFQDQISHPFVSWRHDLRPVDLPGTHFVNPWLVYEGSGRH